MIRHLGMDISFKEGLTEAMPAVAVAAGTVTVKQASSAELDQDALGSGNVVEIDLSGGVKVRYLHLASFNVASGPVKRGDKLGMLGQTGAPGQPHLHFEVYSNDKPVDPIPYLKDTAKNWAFPAAVMR